ncbi:hypothetical protein J1605_006087 [Eschrichtius robustus]|uniref:Uncharacterized protein n=1 Tax=Eschrichtius robustus TaxID=9764 RepID=A0AB34H5C2_ESCRO|nr:hypothetical protein J1605_006087 [Eschrichtius robustus]
MTKEVGVMHSEDEGRGQEPRNVGRLYKLEKPASGTGRFCTSVRRCPLIRISILYSPADRGTWLVQRRGADRYGVFHGAHSEGALFATFQENRERSDRRAL